MGKAGHTGIRRILYAGGHSLNGFVAAFTHEAAFRQEVGLTVVLLPLAFWLGGGGRERALMIGVWLLVLVVELLNSSIETAVDRISDEEHPLAGRAKDLGSAAVFMAFLNAAVVWAILLFTP